MAAVCDGVVLPAVSQGPGKQAWAAGDCVAMLAIAYPGDEQVQVAAQCLAVLDMAWPPARNTGLNSHAKADCAQRHTISSGCRD